MPCTARRDLTRAAKKTKNAAQAAALKPTRDMVGIDAQSTKCRQHEPVRHSQARRPESLTEMEPPDRPWTGRHSRDLLLPGYLQLHYNPGDSVPI